MCLLPFQGLLPKTREIFASISPIVTLGLGSGEKIISFTQLYTLFELGTLFYKKEYSNLQTKN